MHALEPALPLLRYVLRYFSFLGPPRLPLLLSRTPLIFPLRNLSKLSAHVSSFLTRFPTTHDPFVLYSRSLFSNSIFSRLFKLFRLS